MIGYIAFPDAGSIAPVGQFLAPMCAWARQYPHMYTVSETQLVYCVDERARAWWVLRWGDGANLELQDVGVCNEPSTINI